MKCLKLRTTEYRALHSQIERLYGRPSVCEKCGRTKGNFHWHNISKLFHIKRENWIRVCVSCHRKIHIGEKCKNGHNLLDKNNIWIRSNGKRICVICRNKRLKIWRHKKEISIKYNKKKEVKYA